MLIYYLPTPSPFSISAVPTYYKSMLATEKHYIFDNISYKKGIYNGSIVAFIDSCNPYYHISKKKYLERKLSYNTFITILRQICNCNNITYTSKIKYDNSNYEIVYYIFHFHF